MAISGFLMYNRYTFELGGGPEIAVCGFHSRWMGTSVDDAVCGLLSEWAWSKFQLAFSAKAARFSSGVKLREVTVYNLDPADNYKAAHKGYLVDGGGGTSWQGSAAYSLPWETTPAVTLYGYDTSSYQKQARRMRGRMYLPPLATGTIDNSNGLMSHTVVDDLASGVHAWLEAYNDIPTALDNQVHAVVFSRAAASTFDIASLSVDEKIDAQRRRERQQPAPYRNAFTLSP